MPANFSTYFKIHLKKYFLSVTKYLSFQKYKVIKEEYFFIMLDMRRYKNSESRVKFKNCFMVTAMAYMCGFWFVL